MLGDTAVFPDPLPLYTNHRLKAELSPFLDQCLDPGGAHGAIPEYMFVIPNVCTTGGLGLTAEFGFRSGEISAAAGHHYTALWQMIADQPHPEMGSGLFCLLNMPHEISDKDKLDKVIAELNRLEMQGDDLPPPFGAWCRGTRDSNPAYVSFPPNALHSSNGIALNMSIWGMGRAQIADAMLRTMGVS